MPNFIAYMRLTSEKNDIELRVRLICAISTNVSDDSANESSRCLKASSTSFSKVCPILPYVIPNMEAATIQSVRLETLDFSLLATARLLRVGWGDDGTRCDPSSCMVPADSGSNNGGKATPSRFGASLDLGESLADNSRRYATGAI